MGGTDAPAASRSGAERPRSRTEVPPSVARPLEAFCGGLGTAAERDPTVGLWAAGPTSPPELLRSIPLRPGRFEDQSGRATEAVLKAAGPAAKDGPLFVTVPLGIATGGAYVPLVEGVVRPRANVKLVGVPTSASLVPGGPPANASEEGDLARLRGLPGVVVAAPADGPSVRTVTLALAAHDGPAYLRLPSPDAPVVTDGAFEIGRAEERRAGRDLTLVGYGSTLARLLEVADELARVGISARVLDVASLKPFDEAAILRAARDTGAILVAEEASVLTGIGPLVAATTAENLPVPVRRVGIPDVFVEGDPTDRLDRYGLSLDRLRDEAWELLRLRGKLQ